MVENRAIEANPSDIFFNPVVPPSAYQQLAFATILEEKESSPYEESFQINQRRYQNWATKSCNAKPSNSLAFHEELLKRSVAKPKANSPLPLQPVPPPPGFQVPTRRHWADFSPDSEFTPTPGRLQDIVACIQQKEPNFQLKNPPKKTVEKPVKLLPPPKKTIVEEPIKEEPQSATEEAPKKSIKKREDRGTFDNEVVDGKKEVGSLKFYQMKKRFGFITVEKDPPEDVFLCEDDVILSGINHKQFKEKIINKVDLKFEFEIKRYIERGKEKKKAINIRLI